MGLNRERQKELQPGRVEFAKRSIEKLGYQLSISSNGRIQFDYKGSIITLWCYTGWYSGRGIVAGRGIMNLLKQLSKTADIDDNINNNKNQYT